MSIPYNRIVRHEQGVKFIAVGPDARPTTTSVLFENGKWCVLHEKVGSERAVLYETDNAKEAADVLDAMAAAMNAASGTSPAATGAPTAPANDAGAIGSYKMALGISSVLITLAGWGYLSYSLKAPLASAAPPAAIAQQDQQSSEPMRNIPGSVARLQTVLPKITLPPTQTAGADKTKPEKSADAGNSKTTPDIASLPAAQPTKAPDDPLPGGLGRATAEQKGAVDAARKAVAEDPTKAKDQMESMKAAMDALTGDEKLSPDLVRQLPHELAQKLREAGVIATPEEAAAAKAARGEKELRIIRLDQATIDRLRDKDGVQTVPDASSWILTNNSVVVPLPGGGDIRRPEDLTSFHLNP